MANTGLLAQTSFVCRFAVCAILLKPGMPVECCHGDSLTLHWDHHLHCQTNGLEAILCFSHTGGCHSEDCNFTAITAQLCDPCTVSPVPCQCYVFEREEHLATPGSWRKQSQPVESQ